MPDFCAICGAYWQPCGCPGRFATGGLMPVEEAMDSGRLVSLYDDHWQGQAMNLSVNASGSPTGWEQVDLGPITLPEQP